VFSTSPEGPVSNSPLSRRPLIPQRHVRFRRCLSFQRAASRFQETRSPPKGTPTLQPVARKDPKALPGRTTLTSCLSLSGVHQSGCPVQSRSVSQMAPSGTLPSRSLLQTGRTRTYLPPHYNASPHPTKISRPEHKFREPAENRLHRRVRTRTELAKSRQQSDVSTKHRVPSTGYWVPGAISTQARKCRSSLHFDHARRTTPRRAEMCGLDGSRF